jgi:hypothetical protein
MLWSARCGAARLRSRRRARRAALAGRLSPDRRPQAVSADLRYGTSRWREGRAPSRSRVRVFEVGVADWLIKVVEL